MIQQAPALTIATLLLTAFWIPLIGILKKESAYYLALAAIFLSFLAACVTLFSVILHGPIHYRMGGWPPPWGIEFTIDYLNAGVLALIALISFLTTISAKKSVEQEISRGKWPAFWSLYLLLVLSLMGMTETGDMFNMYVYLEVSSLTAYGLIAMGEDGALMASFNYVILGSVGASFYLLGVGYLYIVTGSLNMADLHQLLPTLYKSKVVFTAFAFFIVGIGLKMGLFPLHMWLPDAYTRAPSAISTLIAPTMTKVSAYVFFRIILTVFNPQFSWEVVPAATLLRWIAAVGIIYGSIMAIAQKDIKRMLAYSSISQIGYIVLGIALANQMGLIGGALHIFSHAFAKGCLFMVVMAVIYKTGIRNIDDFKGLNKKMPFTMAAFCLAALSMVGVPPTAGFFSKWYLVLGTVTGKQWLMTAVILASSLLNAVYFFRIIERIYFSSFVGLAGNGHGHHETPAVAVAEAPLTMLIPILIMALGILAVGLFNVQIIHHLLQFIVPKGLA
ncbi:MAG: monovalent cation/H+ antiporter subunit D family protein [Deltaproteobacteria bacterium]|nr:MAG: monovalent cation/H+ antiporter subunit D family protein [Deltaproteobacteria bacterium]